ncbi:MAG: hypothetical protein ACK5Y2_04545 [Bdellovibrionales bacterium]
MDRRGATSFAVLFILNPMVILFYQNCSILPIHSEHDTKVYRGVSSVHEQGLCRFVSTKLPCAE